MEKTAPIKIYPKYRKKPELKGGSKRKTTEWYTHELSIKNPTIAALDEYLGSSVNIRHQCLVCYYIWSARPSNILFGKGCPNCKRNVKLTTETFKEKIPSTIILRSEYKGAFAPIDCECGICHYRWTSKTAHQLPKMKYPCPKCAISHNGESTRLNIDKAKKRVFEINPNIRINSNDYESNRTKADCECLICGYEWKAAFSDLFSGKGCARCGKNLRYTNEEFLSMLPQNILDTILIKTHYVSMKTPLECECKICGYEYMGDPWRLTQGIGCFKCAAKKNGERCRKTHEAYIKEVYKIWGDALTITTKYITAKDRIGVHCNVCHCEWSPIAESVIAGNGCPNCNNSKGEFAVAKYLNENQISYEHPKKYSGLVGVGGKSLSYDFYLPDYNLLIEVQGRQHREPIEFFGGEEQFEIQQEHDKRKREYAETHGIEFLEIWKEDFDNLSEILGNKLNLKLESVTTAGAA